MYLPSHFEQPDVGTMHELMRARPFATLVTLSSSGLNANHIPFVVSQDPAPLGTLQGHVARANPIWRDFSKDVEALAIFHGPHAYITPSWYATKPRTGKVVPTWNYAVVHAYGALRVIDDRAWLRKQIEALTTHHEASFATPWNVGDAPADYIENMVSHIVGVEIVITKLIGKWKVSQNQPAENRAGVIAGLKEIGTADALLMADLIAAADTKNR
ncbi:MAG: FMN-binding negative transcriptional regulator [Sulfurifustaceae bacterium]